MNKLDAAAELLRQLDIRERFGVRGSEEFGCAMKCAVDALLELEMRDEALRRVEEIRAEAIARHTAHDAKRREPRNLWRRICSRSRRLTATVDLQNMSIHSK